MINIPLSDSAMEESHGRLEAALYNMGVVYKEDLLDYDESIQTFQELIKRYPLSKNADNAQFWIGEIYYREKWYEKAILEYQKVIEKYPEGNKAKDALLKQVYAFHNMGDNSSARLILKEMVIKHTQSKQD